MKTTLFVSILSLLILAVGCSTSGTSVSQKNNRPEGSISDDMNYSRNLADYLLQVPGVNVHGSGSNVSVTIRGISSVNLGVTPLYVLDGNTVGNAYNRVNNMLNPRDIDYVRVLKGADAAMYGVRGGNGVIEIVTKRI